MRNSAIQGENNLNWDDNFYLEEAHLIEWRASGVDDGITELNVRSLFGSVGYEYLHYSRLISRRNDGRLREGTLKAYRHIEEGGWWCNGGADPLNDFAPMQWGCFKSNKPRIRKEVGKKDKLIKYEHPLKTATRPFLLFVPMYIWEKVANRYNIAISEKDKENPGGFWRWVWANNVPIVLTEGAKKAGSLLSAGYAAIGLPGIFGGYRSLLNSSGDSEGLKRLIPELACFAACGRMFYICFDYEEKLKTAENIKTATRTTGWLLEREKCYVQVVELPGPGKGVDDFIVANGVQALDSLINISKPLKVWRKPVDAYKLPPAHLNLNQKFLGNLDFPDWARIIAILSPKGTGKTESLIREVKKAHREGRRVLIITHRVQLCIALCERLGINYVGMIKVSEDGQLLGYGLCIDSLHGKSQARFNPDNWADATVIIDEAEQVLWHMFNAKTEISKHRAEVIINFQTLIRNVVNSNYGRVILADADQSNISLDYIQRIGYGPTDDVKAAGAGNFAPVAHPQTYIVKNEYVPKPKTLHLYEGTSPIELIHNLLHAIENGEKVMIHLTGQKSSSTYGSQVLESLLKRNFPDKTMLRIDSETIADKDHPAFGCMANLNTVLKTYDVVIATSCMETGASIDIREHFNSVWGIFQGVHTCDSVRQALARVRDDIPRHIWMPNQAMYSSFIGNGTTNVNSLMESTGIMFNAHIKILSDNGLKISSDSCDSSESDIFEAELLAWARRGSTINSGFYAYQQTVIEGLEKEGYVVEGKPNLVEGIYLGDVPCIQDVKTEIKATCKKIHEIYCQEVANQEDLSKEEYEKIKSKKTKSKDERQKEVKYELNMRYCVGVTPGLVEKDDKGWYRKLLMQYYLDSGNEYLAQRDMKKAKEQVEAGNGRLFKPDFNNSQLSASIQLLEGLGVLGFLTNDVTYTRNSPEMLKLEALAKENRDVIKNYLNVKIGEKMTPIAIAQALLRKLDLKLTLKGKVGGRGKQLRVYSYIPPTDGRESVFAAWLKRDESFYGATSPVEVSSSCP
jgi:Domain of unknown function (DUF3854)